jgi:glutamine synthetase
MEAENVELFKTHEVLTKAELKARTEILLDAYSMTINIEAKTAVNIAQRQIIPVSVEYSGILAKSIKNIDKAGVDSCTQKKMLEKICGLITTLSDGAECLKNAAIEANSIDNSAKKAENYRDTVKPAMALVREAADELETMVDSRLWPLPTYAELLFVK